jgi:hypothetical protein
MIIFSKTSVNSYKFASINFETERMENYHDGMLDELFRFVMLVFI